MSIGGTYLSLYTLTEARQLKAADVSMTLYERNTIIGKEHNYRRNTIIGGAYLTLHKTARSC